MWESLTDRWVSKGMGTHKIVQQVNVGGEKQEQRTEDGSWVTIIHTSVQRSSRRETSRLVEQASEEGDQEKVVSLKLREEFALLDSDQCY